MNSNNYGWDKPPSSVFMDYVNVCEEFIDNDIAFSVFRRNPVYGRILSGDDRIVGEHAMSYIKNIGKLDFLYENIEKVRKNDISGNPYLYDYDNITQINPSTLKYFYVTMEILKIVGDDKIDSIVEIGGGYGGLCRMISSFFDYKRYSIVDLPIVTKVCEKFLSSYSELSDRVDFITCNVVSSNPDDKYDIFIADASLAECDFETQNLYIDKFCKNSKYFYVVWNTLHVSGADNEKNSFLNKMSVTHDIVEQTMDQNIRVITGKLKI